MKARRKKFRDGLLEDLLDSVAKSFRFGIPEPVIDEFDSLFAFQPDVAVDFDMYDKLFKLRLS